ncbi:TolC family protein [bacterium]|nr:TolC family protein [bacterium]
MRKNIWVYVIFCLFMLPETNLANEFEFPRPLATASAEVSNGVSREIMRLLPKNRSISLSLEEAVFTALRNNHQLNVRRLNFNISETAVEKERSRFDTRLQGNLSGADETKKQILSNGKLGNTGDNQTEGGVGGTRLLQTGTEISIDLTGNRSRSTRPKSFFETRLGVKLQVPLKRGVGSSVNTVQIKQAEFDVQISGFELAGFVLSLAAEIEKKYWALFLAEKELEIMNESYRLACIQRDETMKKIALGSVPESELAAADAEVALREEGVIDAQSSLEAARISFLRVINPDSDKFWDFQVTLSDQPEINESFLMPPEIHVERAMENRPEIMQAELLSKKGELELVQTRSGLLPRLDFFLSLGKSGFAKSFEATPNRFWERGYDIEAGFEYDLFSRRREAQANHRKAQFSLMQRRESLQNLRQLFQEDVLTAYLEVKRALQQIQATAKTGEKQKEKVRVEEIRFQVGKTTSFQVAQALRDLAAARIAEIKAKVGYCNALTELFRIDGTLCVSRGYEILGIEEEGK